MGIRSNINIPSSNDIESYRNYVCGHCGRSVSGLVVAFYTDPNSFSPSTFLTAESMLNIWLLCPTCHKGSVVAHNHLYPAAVLGSDINGLPPDVAKAYEETRQCMSVEAFTASELMCRKILMNVAVDKGAKTGDSFQAYLDYLEKSGYITPPLKTWMDLIRQHGNKAAHEIDVPDRLRAESTFTFTSMLLALIYHMDHIAKNFTPPTP